MASVIVGAKRVDQFADNVSATKVALDVNDLAAPDAATKLPAEYPGWMLDAGAAGRLSRLNRHPLSG